MLYGPLNSYWSAITQEYSPHTIYILGTLLLHHTIFWTITLPLLYLDLTHTPAYLHAFKIQPKTHITLEEATKCILNVLLNQFLVMLPFNVLLYYLVVANGGLIINAPLPTLNTILWQGLVCIVVEDILFYYSHRLLHSPYFYQRIHKVHHQFRAPIGMASEYAHPFEFFISSLVPVMVGPLLLKAHIVTAWIWFALAVIGTIAHHCGYTFPFLVGGMNPSFHDYHHQVFNANYGLTGWLDKFHGTFGGVAGRKQEERLSPRRANYQVIGWLDKFEGAFRSTSTTSE